MPSRLFKHSSPASAILLILSLIVSGCLHSTPRKTEAHTAPAALTNTNSFALTNTSVVIRAPNLTNNPPARSPAINGAQPSIFIAGDSTAARGGGQAQQGWGVPFADYFDPTKVNVVNRARGGRSSRTFITEGLWDQLIADIKPGDIVLIQFGHNDGGAVNDATRARGSLHGLGEETQEMDNLLTQQHEVVHTFGWYLRKMIRDTRARGATPIVLSLTVRDIWKDGKVERGSGHYSEWAAEIAKSTGAPFIDVTTLMAEKFDSLGEEKVHLLYPQDHTHFNPAGADLYAAAIVSALKNLHSNPVRQFLSAKGQLVQTESQSWPTLPQPPDPSLPTLFLIGDSTVRNGRGDGTNGQWGWGDYVGAYFDRKKINVVNRAVGGISSRTFLTQGHWNRVLATVKRGDFVMMQFGHNDGGDINDPARARATIKGTGNDALEIANALTGQPETVHTYGWYLRKYISDIRSKGATPIVCSLVPRKIWKDGRIQRDKASYAGWAAEVAQAENVSFLDLNELVATEYDRLGTEKVDELFADEHTHTNAKGAELTARCIAAGLKALRANPLAAYQLADKP